MADVHIHEAESSRTGEILERLDHIHALLHTILRMQGLTKQQIEELIQASDDAEKMQNLVASLRGPTEELDASVKANQ